MDMRHWVLVAPFGPNDFTVYADRDERRAIADYNARRAAGETVSFVTGTGTVSDIRTSLKTCRATYVAALAEQVKTSCPA